MADRQQIVDTVVVRIHEVLPDLAADEGIVDRDLREVAGFDSLGVLELLVWLENEFSLTIPDEELVVDHFNTVNKIADYVLAHR